MLKLLRLLPFCEEAVEQAMQAEYVLFAEEGIESGGIGQMFGSRLLENGFQGHYRVLAVHDRFVEQATPDPGTCPLRVGCTEHGADLHTMDERTTNRGF